LNSCQDGSPDALLITEFVHPKNYPYKIYAKTADEIAVLQSEFDSLNENKICTILNQFGFTDDANCQEENVEENIVDQQKILSLVKSTLVKNSKFTNVLDTLNLEVRKVYHADRSPSLYSIYFEDQVVDGITVEESRILVFFYGNYVYQIRGSWYPKIPIPPKGYGISILGAKNKIIRKKIEYYCWSPLDFTITWQSIVDEYTIKCIYPIVDDNSIEFRYVYRFSVRRSIRSDQDFHIYVDIITGEIIRIEPLFIC
jgi:hypothetical protein